MILSFSKAEFTFLICYKTIILELPAKVMMLWIVLMAPYRTARRWLLHHMLYKLTIASLAKLLH